MQTVLIGFGVVLGIYAGSVFALIAAGRRGQARALAGFNPDCLVLFKRLLADDRVSRTRKVLLVVMVGYLAMPFDLVPDFIPIAGQLDDAILVALTLRVVLRGGGPVLIEEHWPGPPQSRTMILRLAFGKAALPVD